jgi:hypothetical protein
MRRSIGAALWLGCVLVVGCATTQTRTYRLPATTSAPATWTGRAVDDVLEAWGPPSVRTSDGEGGTLLVYEEKTGVSAAVEEGGPSPPDLDPTPSSGPTKSEQIKRVKAKFWVDREGNVYRFWFSPSVYKKGLDTPPAKKQ